MQTSAEDIKRRDRIRKQAQFLLRVIILLAAVTAFAFVLSFIPELSRLPWLRQVSEIAGACDGIIFFVLMFWQLANDRTELLVPIQDATEKHELFLQRLSEQIPGIRQELHGIRDQIVHVANTRRLADSGAYMQRLLSELHSAVSSEPRETRPVLRLMRLSGHWRLNARLEHTADLLAKFFDHGNTSGPWSDRWEVRMLYAIADKETLSALMGKKAILGRVMNEGPTNYTFRLIARNGFEPSIGLAVIADESAFVGFDESTNDPFPEQGLEIRGDAVGWFVAWFDQMFQSSCAQRIYERGRTEYAAIENLSKMLRSATGQS